jgi:hypothetical protein
MATSATRAISKKVLKKVSMCVNPPRLGAHLHAILVENALQLIELALVGLELARQLRIALEELRLLALELASLLDHQLLQHLLTQLRDRQNRTGALAALVGGGLVRSVVALVAHATSIRQNPLKCKPLERYSANISHFVVTPGAARGYACIGHGTVKFRGGESHPVRG